MLTLEFKQCKSDTSIYYFIDKKTRELVIAIVNIDNVCFIDSKNSLLFLELKQKFMTKWKCHNLRETKEFLGIYINHNLKDQKIFVNQSKYLNKVIAWFNITTNLTSIHSHWAICLNSMINSAVSISIKNNSKWLNL